MSENSQNENIAHHPLLYRPTGLCPVLRTVHPSSNLQLTSHF